MFYFYVLFSLKDGRLYKGATADLPKRVLRHNNGGTASTKNRRPLVLVYFEAFEQKSKAWEREAWSKSLEGGAELKEILIDKLILDLEGRLFDQANAG